MDGQNYVPCGDDLIAPFEISNLADHLVGTNNLENYMLWVIILVSIKLFLRGAEVCGYEKVGTEKRFTGIGETSFDWSSSTFKNGEFETIAIRIKGVYMINVGKTDKVIKTMTLWRDHQNPKFCPVLHLQLYMYLIGWRGGQLFPSTEELKKVPADGVFKTTFGSQNFDQRLKDIAKKLFLPLRMDKLNIEEPLVEEGVQHSRRKKKTPT